MAHGDNKSIVTNTAMLFIMNIATMVFPLVTLPYLTRVLSNEMYGTIVYIRAVMGYMQTLIDFGFILSATKDIVRANGSQEKINQIVSNTVAAKLLLAFVGLCALIVLMCTLPILQQAKLLTMLFYLGVVQSIFLLDFLFRGVEQMHIITIRYVVMKGLSTVLTFVFVKSDADVLFIPVLEALGYIAAIVLVAISAKRLCVRLVRPSLPEMWKTLKESAVYFASNMASTSYGALNTLLLGIMLPASDIAYWGVCMQIVAAIQSFYTPITNGVYPAMVLKREFKIIKRLMYIFMPIITVGCVLSYFLASFGLTIVGGADYVAAVPVFRCLIPTIFLGFPAILFGWPALGAIGKVKENSATTIISLSFQIVGLLLLILCGKITIITAAILRSATEAMMCGLRMWNCYRFRREFADSKAIQCAP